MGWVAAGREPRRLRGAPGSILLLVAFLVSIPAVTTRIYASDEVQFFAWLRSLAFDHDASFENEYRFFYDSGIVKNPSFRETFLEGTNEAGRRHNFTPIGSALLWAPFYAGGHVVAMLTGAPRDGFSRPYVAAVAYGSAVYGFLGVLLSAAIARRVVGRGLLAATAIWCGSPLIYYMYVTPPFSHACSAFAVSLFIWTWLRTRDRWSAGGMIALGATGALMAMVREQDVFFLAGPALDFARWTAVRPTGIRSALRAATIGAGAFALAYSPQLLAYQALNGHPSPTVFVARKMSWTSPHILQVLFNPEHGLFAWTPLALLAAAGLAWLALGRVDGAVREARWIGFCAIVMFALQAYIAGAVESWTVAGAFGQRRFVALTPVLVLGLAAWIADARSWRPPARAALVGTIVLGIWWNLGLIVQFGQHTMDRQRLTLRDNARMTFLVLPRQAPSIVWQYLTHRDSFFGQPRQ